MKNRQSLLMLLSCCFFSISCSDTTTEEKGYKYLSMAREYLAAQNFNKARCMIDSLRTNCPLALNAREEGILLLDSIELFDAKSQIQTCDSSQTEKKEELNRKSLFYQKKLIYDRKNKKKHEYCIKNF